MDIIKQPLSKDEKQSIALAVVLALLGYLSAIFTCDDVFARFGALIVCVGVYFGAKGFPLKASKIKEIADEMWEEDSKKILSIFDAENSVIPIELRPQAKAEFLAKANEIKAKGSRSVYALEMRWVRVESTIIMAGTLIWAFGDYLVPNIYSICAQC